MTQKRRRVEALEQAVGGRDVRVEDLPDLVVYWPEDETRETRRQQARVKRLWQQAGVDWTKVEVRLEWGDEAEECLP